MSNTRKHAFTSPKGVAVYPWLNSPDTQFDATGQYKVNLRMTKEAAKPIIDAVKEAANDAFGAKAKSARMPFKTDEETGDIIMVTKSKYKPKFVDSAGGVIAENSVPQIFGGSEIKVAGSIYPYTGQGVGISMQLGAVQLITLAERSNTQSSYSFEPVKDGFVAANDNEEGASEDSGYNF